MMRIHMVFAPLALIFGLASALNADTFLPGDLLYATNQGDTVEWYRGGSLVSTLTPSPANGVANSLAFDSSGDLYVSQEGSVGRFDSHGNFLGTFATTASSEWGGLAFNNAGDLFAGTQNGSITAGSGIFEFNTSGGLIHNYVPGAIVTGLALESNQNIMLFTDESGTVHSVNLTTGMETTFATTSGANTGITVLANGDVLVAGYTSNAVYLLDSQGNLLKTYSGLADPTGLTIDPTGTSFWTTNYYNSTVEEVSLTTGVIEQIIGGVGDRADGIAIYAGPSTAAVAPEPSALALMGSALLSVFFLRRRKRATPA